MILIEQYLSYFYTYISIAMKKKASEIVPISSTEANPVNKKSEPKSDDVRGEALAGVLYQIERSYGKGSIQRLGDQQSMVVETMSSGSMTLDLALGGGYPKGRVIEIYGPESSGKTTLALHAVAEIQKAGGLFHEFLIFYYISQNTVQLCCFLLNY